MTIERLPLAYRTELIGDIHRHLAAGKCGALIGVSSSGKSRLVEFLTRPDVREEHLGPDWPATLFAWVDGNDLLDFGGRDASGEWGLYETILSAILTDLDRLPDRGGPAREVAEAWYWRLIRPEESHLARRFVARAITEMPGVRRVVLMLDDCEDFLGQASDQVLRGLRSLRDRLKQDNQYRVLYLLATRRQPIALRETDSPAFESFLELFKDFTRPIGCYTERDALHMIERLSEAFPLMPGVLNAETRRRLVEVTGGHAGLIDAAFHSKTESQWGQRKLAEVLLASGGVWNECNSIWGGLDAADQDALLAVARGRDPGHRATRWLEKGGLVIREIDQLPRVFPLLNLYLTQAYRQIPQVTVDAALRVLHVEDARIEGLSQDEAVLLDCLQRHRGRPCTYQELFEAVYPNQVPLGDLQADVQAIVQRVQTRVRNAGVSQSILIHFADHGYQLVGPLGDAPRPG